VVEASHLMQRKVMAHAIGLTGIRAAARFGVDSIEHGNELDEETAKLMAAKGTYLVPTIYASYDILRRIRAPGPTAGFPISQNTRDKMLALPEAQPGGMCRQVRVAVKFGVKIGVGSDFGSARDEARLLVELCGFTPDRALRAATIDNAELLGISTLAGSLSAGKSADVIAFAADPRKDIAALTSPVFVMARGEVLKPATASRR
jgi:imidazolonepropionase-like amidohydrolase